MKMNNLIEPAHEHPHHLRVVIIIAVILGVLAIGGGIYYGITKRNATQSESRQLEKTLKEAETFFNNNPSEPMSDVELKAAADFFKNN